jgi:hypothetical protein
MPIKTGRQTRGWRGQRKRRTALTAGPLLAVFFPFMRMLDAAISLYSVPAAWLSVSNGRWKSPARRPVGGAATASLHAAGLPASGVYLAGTKDEPERPARVAEASHVSG